MPRKDFSERLKATPQKPGVYIMRDVENKVLYVGKAFRLRNRVSSYFNSPNGQVPKIRNMVTRVDDFEFIVTESEQEALILECNLIKEHQPPYNARLKDDKSYPFIKIDDTEDYPLVYVTRNVKKDGSRYFGPFASAYSVRTTLGLLKKLFPYRSCTKAITGTDDRACLDFHINRCVGPCIGAVDKDQYKEIIDQVALFLEGKTDPIVKSISKQMIDASETLEFERAAALRDQLQAIEKVNEGQKVLHLTSENLDIIAAATGPRQAWVEVFFIRQGKLVGRDNFIMDGTQDDSPEGVLTAFVKQFYDATPYIPPRIVVQHPVEETGVLEGWLREKRNGSVKIQCPQRGEKKRLVQMVAENAEQGLEHMKIRQLAESENLNAAMDELQEALNLPRPPKRIECYDISNIQGTNTVGSMVVFEDGKSKTSNYRRFKIKTVKGIDDYSSMREMLTRRFKRLGKARQNDESQNSDESANGKASSKTNESFGVIPDLVLIDGGKGHLGAALQVFLELGIDDIPLASLAKENEELFVPYMQESILLPRNSQGLFLVQRARDEAHRFAITFHRERRSKSSVKSALDMISGIGPKRRGMLMRKFGSVKGIREASVEDIASSPGMTMKLAVKIKDDL